MFDRSVEPDPRPAAPPSRNRSPMRKGHRREYAADRARGFIPFSERCAGALADIGVHGAVSYRDLSEIRFGGHPYTTRRAVDAWIRDGLVSETTATGPNGNPFKILTLTPAGMADARELAGKRGMDPDQRIEIPRIRSGQASHDTAVYRACAIERERLRRRRARVRRVRLDAELKSAVARASESARKRNGKRAADAARHRAARDLGLPVDGDGRVLYPDAQIEYEDADGRSGRVNIESVSDDYRQQSVRAKAAAGFAMHASGPGGASLMSRLGLGSGDGGSWLKGPADRDPASVEL